MIKWRMRLVALCFLASTSSVWASSPYKTLAPAGAGPHPAVLLVSGCSGFTPSIAPGFYDRVAGQLQGKGYVVVYVDYLGRRGLQSCNRGVTSREAAQDLLDAASWLKTQPEVDPARIEVVGWSFGGGAALVALQEQPAFGRVIVFYPFCRDVRPWKVSVPVLMLLAGDDDIAPGRACQEAATKRSEPGRVKGVVYSGARHAFDVEGLPPKAKYQFGTIGYDPQAAAAAWTEARRFLGVAE